MGQTFNIYCDESCHLLRDDNRAMVIGAIWCPINLSRRIADDIRDLKERHELKRFAEIKWRGVSPSKLDYYLDLIEYFNREAALCFRAVIIPDKSILKHEEFEQTHDDFYYKIYFRMLESIITTSDNRYRIFLDIKDTKSAEKVEKLREVLCNNLHDFEQDAIPVIQNVRSHEIQQLQLADLLIGAISYANSFSSGDKDRSKAKWEIIRKIKSTIGVSLTQSTDRSAFKFNILKWQGRRGFDV